MNRRLMSAALGIAAVAALMFLPSPKTASGQALPVTTNLFGWYEANTGVVVNSNTATGGSQVVSWADQSGNGHNLQSDGGAPTLNPTGFNGSLPAVQLNSVTGDFLRSVKPFSLNASSPNMTIFVVFTDTTTSPDSHPFTFGTHAAAATVATGNNTSFVGVAGGFGANVNSTYASSPASQMSNIIESFRYTGGSAMNSATSSVKINGTEYFTPSGSSASSFTSLNAAGSYAWVGAAPSSDGQAIAGPQVNGMVGDVAEILMYNGVLTTAQESAVGFYLTQKYSLTTAYAPAGVSSNWTGATSTNWGDANWSGAVPGVSGATDATATNTDTAVFNANPTNAVPVIDSGRNLQTVTFDTANVGALTLGSTTGNALLLTGGGTIQTTAKVAAAQNVNAPLVLEGGAGSYTFFSGAIANAATLSFGGPITAGGTTGTTTLTLGGSNGGANTISGAIGGGNGATLALTTQSGNWILSGTNTYTGATTVTGGTLRVGNGTSGSLGATAISISGGSLVLAAGGSIGNTSVAVTGTGIFTVPAGSGTLAIGTTGGGTSGATLSLASGGALSMVDGAIGTFNLQQQSGFTGPVLTFNGGTLNFDLSSSAADKMVVGVGSVSTAGTNTVNVLPVGSSLANGTYTLISAPAGGLGGTFQSVTGGVSSIVGAGTSLYKLTLNNSSTVESVTVGAPNYIFQDAFTGTSGTTINAKPASPVDVPGANYSIFGQSTTGTVNYNGSGVTVANTSAQTANKGAGISLASTGLYVKPAILTISAGLTLNNVAAGTLSNTSYFGAGLGFYSALPTTNQAFANFRGLVIEPTGTVALVNTSSVVEYIEASVAWPTTALGAFSTSTS